MILYYKYRHRRVEYEITFYVAYFYYYFKPHRRFENINEYLVTNFVV